MIIGAVIPSFGLAKKLERSIRAYFASETRHELQLCLIDNGTIGDSVYQVCQSLGIFDNIYYVHMPYNFHFARASNTGIHVLGQVDAFLFLNNDCYVEPDCVEKMAQAMMGGQGDIIGAKLLYPDGTVQHAGGMIEGNWEGVFHEFRGLKSDAPEVCKSRQVPFVTGACMLVRASHFVRLGGFMEVFHNSFEDTDLCLRFKEKGLKVYYCAEAVGIHEEAQTPGRKDHDTENAKIFFHRWNKVNADRFR